MIAIVEEILRILDDLTDEVDAMSRNPNSRTMNVSLRIGNLRKELRKLENND